MNYFFEEASTIIWLLQKKKKNNFNEVLYIFKCFLFKTQGYNIKKKKKKLK